MKNVRKSLKIGICSETLSTIEFITQAIRKKEKILGIDIKIFRFSLKELMADKSSECDIMYLDLQAEKNFFQDVENYNGLKQKGILIAISTDDGHAQVLLELEVFRLLVKPFNKLTFDKYFFEAINKISFISKVYCFKYNRIRYKVRLDEIIYFQSDKRMIYIITDNSLKKIYQCYKSLNDIEAEVSILSSTFLRIHQSFFVNLFYVKSFTESSVELKDGSILGISRRRKIEAIKIFEEFNIPRQSY